jgi:hypothetical protein
MDENDIRVMVLKTTLIGATRADVEAALRTSFQRTWTEASRAVISERGFAVAVATDDYYISSRFGSDGILLPKVVTIYFLFDKEDNLKDVSVQVWNETL